jgi:NOL1/NOP2/fmu family ribosome biogenesis protein
MTDEDIELEDEEGFTGRRRKERKESPPSPEHLYSYLETRFGIGKEVFDGYRLYLGSKNQIYLGPKCAVDKLKIACIGISIARMDSTIKPTTNFFQIFGELATKNALDLTSEQAVEYVKGNDLTVRTTATNVSDGYVLLMYKGNSLGCGLLKSGIIKNMLPKAKRMKLSYI